MLFYVLLDRWQSVFLSKFQQDYDARRFGLKPSSLLGQTALFSPSFLIGHRHIALLRSR
jgi:hypothetical protein